MKALLSLTLLSLALGSFFFLSNKEETISRGPASYTEKRTLNIKEEREQNKKNQELFAKYDELQRKYAEIESLKAELQASEEGLVTLQYYMTSPSTELIMNNESLANYLALSKVNNTSYETELGEVRESATASVQSESFFYGLPYASRSTASDQVGLTERNFFYPVSNPGNYTMSVY